MLEGLVPPTARSPACDVAIIGGGPAGISTALHLQAAAPAARIVVLEKARYPREKIGAGGVAGIVRRQAGLPRGALRAQVVELDTEAAPGDLPRDTIVFDFATRALRGYAWDFPTLVDDRPLVCRGVYALGVAADHPRD